MVKREKQIYSLIPLEDFKTILNVDDREERTARFCLIASTLSIERYCKRHLLRKKHFEHVEFFGDLNIPLSEYPVNEILAVYLFGNGEILEPEFYNLIPERGTDYDLPFCLTLSPALKRYSNITSIKTVYLAGYAMETAATMPPVPADLSAACLELASWNMRRYRSGSIGVAGNARGSGKDGGHYELSMPENIRLLLEPYRRKTI